MCLPEELLKVVETGFGKPKAIHGPLPIRIREAFTPRAPRQLLEQTVGEFPRGPIKEGPHGNTPSDGRDHDTEDD